MKILQVMAGAENGGAEAAFEDMCLALAERIKDNPDIEMQAIIRVGHPDRMQRLVAGGVVVHALPFGGMLDFITQWKMKRIIKCFKPQIVQTWMSRASKKTPASQDKSYLKFSRLGGYYGLKYYKSTDYFVTNTPDIKRHLEENGIDPSRIRHINNFAASEREIIPVTRSSLQTPDDAYVIIALARYHQVKALDTLIKSIVPINNAHLWLAGEGPLETELKQLAQALGVSSRVHFLGWRTDRAALLQAADVCALPSRFEPFGSTFVQAWAQKTPLVCSDAQGPKQFVKDGEDALMFKIDDLEALTNALNRMRHEKGLAEKLVDSGYQRYINEFSKDKTVSAYLEYYADALKAEQISV
ncbi:MAG: glycosyltransferase [Pseudobdellovibrionaceae bacterium]|jgi:glycosyltransferase involved in cell wall biosynthesis|nr:glycosyltransferase [Pseudobdellovibrionaceae bacterium]